jgi:glycosyltransferase involved in cell wall biosynthesis
MMVAVGGSGNHAARSVAYHLLLATPFDLDEMEAAAARGEGPRHFLYRVREALAATVHRPGDVSPRLVDTLAGRVLASPEVWALARRLARDAADGDVVFAYDNDGLALALAALARRKRLGILLSTMSPERGRFRLVAGRSGLHRRIDRFLVNTADKRQTLVGLGVPPERIWVHQEQTDTAFFTPGPATPGKARPVLFAAGKEQRDYRTLAEATADLDVDVRICAASPNASPGTAVTYPDPVPANMTFAPYPWPEFVQAYRDADVVVVPLLAHRYSAGLTVVMEALACRRPVVATAIGGIADLVDDGLVAGCAVGDAGSLRAAITALLDDPATAADLAERGYGRVLAAHTSDAMVHDVVAALRALGATAAIDAHTP